MAFAGFLSLLLIVFVIFVMHEVPFQPADDKVCCVVMVTNLKRNVLQKNFHHYCFFVSLVELKRLRRLKYLAPLFTVKTFQCKTATLSMFFFFFLGKLFTPLKNFYLLPHYNDKQRRALLVFCRTEQHKVRHTCVMQFASFNE